LPGHKARTVEPDLQTFSLQCLHYVVDLIVFVVLPGVSEPKLYHRVASCGPTEGKTHLTDEVKPGRTGSGYRCQSRLLGACSWQGIKRLVVVGGFVNELAPTCAILLRLWPQTTAAASQVYRLRLITADPLSLRSRTVCDLPCKATLITPEIPYSLL
jgi:hypothetical protein